MLKLIFLQLLHGIKILRDWNVISVDGSWTLRHVLENVVDGTDSRYERDSWTLDTALRGLPLVCKVELRWNLVSTFGLSCKEVEKGVAWLSLVHCEMLDYACTAHFFMMEIDFSKKKKPCALLDFTYFLRPETGY